MKKHSPLVLKEFAPTTSTSLTVSLPDINFPSVTRKGYNRVSQVWKGRPCVAFPAGGKKYPFFGNDVTDLGVFTVGRHTRIVGDAFIPIPSDIIRVPRRIYMHRPTGIGYTNGTSTAMSGTTYANNVVAALQANTALISDLEENHIVFDVLSDTSTTVATQETWPGIWMIPCRALTGVSDTETFAWPPEFQPPATFTRTLSVALGNFNTFVDEWDGGEVLFLHPQGGIGRVPYAQQVQVAVSGDVWFFQNMQQPAGLAAGKVQLDAFLSCFERVSYEICFAPSDMVPNLGSGAGNASALASRDELNAFGQANCAAFSGPNCNSTVISPPPNSVVTWAETKIREFFDL
jgi:hypothetical protein